MLPKDIVTFDGTTIFQYNDGDVEIEPSGIHNDMILLIGPDDILKVINYLIKAYAYACSVQEKAGE